MWSLYRYDYVKTNQTEKYNIPSSKDCFSILSFPDKSQKVPRLFLSLNQFYVEAVLGNKSEFVQMELNVFNPKQRHVPRSTANLSRLGYTEQLREIEEEVVECGKTVFAATPNELEAEIAYYARKYPWLKFYRSKDMLMSNPNGISIEHPGTSKIPRHASSLVESGIYSRLRKEEYHRKNFKRQPSGVYKPPRDEMTMNGCILTLFILCGGLAGFSILALGAEWCNSVKEGIGICISKNWRSYCSRKQKGKKHISKTTAFFVQPKKT